MTNYNKIIKELKSYKNPQKAKILAGFFKTKKGEYGEGDIFWGITVPVQRKIAKSYSDLSLKEIKKLISSKVHEHRLTALLILINKFQKEIGKKKQVFEIKEKIFNFYFKHIKFINNWDLVDLSAPKIVGEYLRTKDKSILLRLSKSSSVWERRIAVLSTFALIKSDKFRSCLKISAELLNDKHDLIHKAVGWMLREIGKRDQKKEEAFLEKYKKKMPRTMLRYAIERFNNKKKKYYLKK